MYKSYRSKYLDAEFQFVSSTRGSAPPETVVGWVNGGSGVQFGVLQALNADFLDFFKQVKDFEAELSALCSPGTNRIYASSSSCNNCCLLPEFLPQLKAITTPTPPAGTTYPVRLGYNVPGIGNGSSGTLNMYLGISNPLLKANNLQK